MFKLLLHAWFCRSKIFLVRMEPPLIRVLQRSGKRRHDLPAVSQIAADFSPFLIFADLVETASNFNGLLEFVEVERPLVDAWKTV